jgi:hypothetical protein
MQSIGLYQYSVSSGYQLGLKENQKEDGTINLISTVAENRQGYTLRQFERAKAARKLYHMHCWYTNYEQLQVVAPDECHPKLSCDSRRRQHI